MLNICEVFVGRAMVTDPGRANTCRRKFKAPWLQKKYKKWRTFWKRVSRENRWSISDEEKQYISSLDQTTLWHTRPLNATIEIKTVETWQD